MAKCEVALQHSTAHHPAAACYQEKAAGSTVQRGFACFVSGSGRRVRQRSAQLKRSNTERTAWFGSGNVWKEVSVEEVDQRLPHRGRNVHGRRQHEALKSAFSRQEEG